MPLERFRDVFMFDLPALPIAFALTLWDVVPIFLSVSLSLAVVIRVSTGGLRFTTLWKAVPASGIEGLIYLALFLPALLPALAVSSVVLTVVTLRGPMRLDTLPATPGRAIRDRLEDAIFPILIASAAAAYVKIAGPEISGYGVVAELAVASLAGLLTGNRFGTAAIPAVAAMVHMGGTGPALACVVGATIRGVILDQRERRQETATGT